MKKITRWRPDTCECEIEYEWDDSVPAEKRTHAVSRVIKKCAAHEKTATHEEHYEKVLGENQRKNIFYAKMLEMKALADEVTDEDGRVTKVLKKGLQYKWHFDANRNLVVDTTGFPAKEKKALKNLARAEFNSKINLA
jgi:dihydrodipicolinate reductase